MSIDNIPKITLSNEEIDRALNELLPITGNLISRRIINGFGDFHSITIIDKINCRGMDIRQDLVFNAVNMGSGIDFSETTLCCLGLHEVVADYLCLDRAVMDALIIDKNSSIKNLIMNNAVINGSFIIRDALISDKIELRGLEVKGHIKIVTKGNPKEILVSENMAQRIHLAAPTVPLVVFKNKD